MALKQMRNSELVIADDGTLYHLGLKSDDNIPKNIFLVGDPQRTYRIAKYFDKKKITFEQKNREFITVCGLYKKMPVAVIGTGIGPDNTEIVAVELHILNEFNPKKQMWDDECEPLNIIRIGTSGSPQKDIAVGSLAISEYAVGLDNAGIFYPFESIDATVKQIIQALNQTDISLILLHPYVSQATPSVVRALIKGCQQIDLKENQERGFCVGITSSAPGFYAPQGRRIGRLGNILIPNLQEILAKINAGGKRIVNNEMESSAMFRILGEKLRYRVGTICAVLANRNTKEVVNPEEYKNSVDRAIRAGLEAMRILNK